tara:strand:- start:160 stop:531 length:372 start_codon:yes stop_codon:yes gene_type:complete
MAQPTLFTKAQSEQLFEFGHTVQKSRRVRRFVLGNGYEQVTPDGIQTEMRTYSLKTRPLSDSEATSYDDAFDDLNGDFFYAQFIHDDGLYKYRLEPNEWSIESIGPDTNILTFSVRRIYDSRS